MHTFFRFEKHSTNSFNGLLLFIFLLIFSRTVSAQVTLGFQGGEAGDTWGYTSTGASALSLSEATQAPNKVTGATSLVVGGNTGGGNCFATGSGNGPNTARTFTFDQLDISSSNASSRTLTFNWGNRFPACSGTGWDSGENLTFTAFHNGIAQTSITLASGNNNAQFSIQSNSTTWTIPPCVSSFYFVVSVNTNRADELLFIDNVTLTAPQLNNSLAVSPITGNISVCSGSSESYTVTPEAGISYTWSGLLAGASFTTANGTTGSSPMTVNWGTASPGNYTLTVTPSNACGNTGTPQTLSVTVLPAPTPMTISGPTSLCSGDTITLTSSYATGNSWLPTGETTPSISVSQAGTYTVSATTSCGVISASQTVTLNTSNPASITPNGPTSFCPGGSVTLTSDSPSGNSWSTGETTPSITVSNAGNYVLTVAGICGNTSVSQQVTLLPLPTPQIAGTVSFCAGQQTTLTASGGDTYVWSTSETSTSIIVTTAGNYTVTAFNSCGQTTSAPVSITENPLPNPQITGVLSFCAGQQTTLTASGGDSYLWSTGATTTSITVSTPGNYTLTATTGCGQATTAPVTVTENPLPNPQITGTTTFCAGQQTTLTASGGDSYLWSNGATTPSIVVTAAGTYIVGATNGCGQAASLPVLVTEMPLPVAQISGISSFCVGQQTKLTASGGNTYLWSTGETGTSITVNTAGNYTLTASNSCGTNAASVTVTTSSISALFTVNTATGAAPLPVNFTNASGPSAVSFAWNFDDGSTETTSSPSHTFHQAGQYTVELTATNAAGCSDTYSLVIEVLDMPSSLTIPNIFTPNGDHLNDQFVVKAERMERYSLVILNRWGNVIRSIDNPEDGWDGTIQGDQATEGTYFYQITATGTDKKNYNETGFFELIR
jgi:gliding motility-associated-like protein